eukprot:TRINITY_DN27637_c0_g2_i1.p1 TRINITY_DN27637_c0_g2~~TRINITY_DN27637_c0_g2_i1.p1  ORF type:complete len:104 (-),score=23.52 TRINITY_DN27637_c0_g2_i1:136-447(-)
MGNCLRQGSKQDELQKQEQNNRNDDEVSIDDREGITRMKIVIKMQDLQKLLAKNGLLLLDDLKDLCVADSRNHGERQLFRFEGSEGDDCWKPSLQSIPEHVVY